LSQARPLLPLLLTFIRLALRPKSAQVRQYAGLPPAPWLGQALEPEGLASDLIAFMNGVSTSVSGELVDVLVPNIESIASVAAVRAPKGSLDCPGTPPIAMIALSCLFQSMAAAMSAPLSASVDADQSPDSQSGRPSS